MKMEAILAKTVSGRIASVLILYLHNIVNESNYKKDRVGHPLC